MTLFMMAAALRAFVKRRRSYSRSRALYVSASASLAGDIRLRIRSSSKCYNGRMECSRRRRRHGFTEN